MVASVPGKWILVVEDNSFTRLVLQAALEAEGYRVTGAGNGREGLDWLGGLELPALILLDLMMPDMDGWEFTARMREDSRLSGIPVVIVSAVADIEEQAGRVTAQRFLQKPYDLETLFDLVRQCTATI